MPERIQIDLEGAPAPDYEKRYLTQKRLADALSGLFKTLGSTLHVEHVANVGLLTLTGQLLIKCAAFFSRDDHGNYRKLATVGAHRFHHTDLTLPADIPQIAALFREPRVLAIGPDSGAPGHPALAKLWEHGFRGLFPLSDGSEALGIMALGPKIRPGALTAEDLQTLQAFSVVISVSLKNSIAYQFMEASRNEHVRLNELKEEFLAHVSHEFRTPITVLKTISDMGGLEPEVQEMQASALSRLEHLVNSVLLLNELNANGVQLARTIMDVRSWVHSQVSPMLARHGKFELHTHLPACSLELDWVKLGTALESVVDNAVKFGAGDRSGQVSIYLSIRSHLQTRRGKVGMRFDGLDIGLLMPPAEVDPHDPDALLVIEVKDRGIGIPPEELETVFQPFTQAANSPTRGVKGAGLGLAMVRSIVAAHGGEILCRSAVGDGTIVTMVLPIGNLPGEFGASTSQPPASV